MKNSYVKKREQGFTIIEVLIVLAIAGLIILIVFLAVPALQRNQRNSARDADANRISTAVNDCLSNKNGRVPSCSSVGADAVTLEEREFSQLKTAAGALTNITFCGGQGGTACTAFTRAAGTADWVPNVNVRFGERCNAAGDNSEASTTRQYVVLYQTENAQGRGATKCVGI